MAVNTRAHFRQNKLVENTSSKTLNETTEATLPTLVKTLSAKSTNVHCDKIRSTEGLPL